MSLPAHVASRIEAAAPWDPVFDPEEYVDDLDEDTIERMNAAMVARYEAELDPMERAFRRYEAELEALVVPEVR